MSNSAPNEDFSNKDALLAFDESKKDGLHPDDTGGKFGQRFGEKLNGVKHALLPEFSVKRSEVFALVDGGVETKTVCAAVMAWGG